MVAMVAVVVAAAAGGGGSGGWLARHSTTGEDRPTSSPGTYEPWGREQCAVERKRGMVVVVVVVVGGLARQHHHRTAGLTSSVGHVSMGQRVTVWW